MNADDYKPGEYGPLTPSPEGETPSPEEEEKKKNKKSSNKKKALVGLAALLVAGGCCVGSTFLTRCQPPVREETAVVEVMPTNTPYVAPQSPTATEAEQEPIDVREGWYGSYEGITTGSYHTQIYDYGTLEFKNNRLWLDIMGREDCLERCGESFSSVSRGFCGGDLSWGVDMGFVGEDFINVRLYLPEDLSDAPGLTITEDRLTVTPTEEHPYELVIEQVDGQLEGYLLVDYSKDPRNADGWPAEELWAINYSIAKISTEEHPCQSWEPGSSEFYPYYSNQE